MSSTPAPLIRYAVFDRSGHLTKILPESISTPEEARRHTLFHSDRISRVRVTHLSELPETPPSQVTNVERIREHREFAIALFPVTEESAASAAYRRAVIDTLNWILNGGEPPTFLGIRRCWVCGCTKNDASWCIGRTGKPCHWVSADLCSACAAEQGEGDLPAAEPQLPKEAL